MIPTLRATPIRWHIYACVVSIVCVQSNRETGPRVPDNRIDDAETEAVAEAGRGTEARERGPSGVNSSIDGARLRVLSVLPVLLGASICVLNVLVALSVWRSVYKSNSHMLSNSNLPTTVFLSSLLISFFIGILVIAYSMVLRRIERSRQAGGIPQESTLLAEPDRIPSYVKWIIVPIAVAMPAPIITVWATQLIESIAPTPCIELYREAVSIRNDEPNFRMAWTDRDQMRCAINQSTIPQ